jgi:predicted acyl esterase
MHLASDYIHPTPRGGRCRIRIYLPEEEQDAPVVISSELPNNGGTSVTYAAEQLAAEVIRSHELPTPLVWIEH